MMQTYKEKRIDIFFFHRQKKRKKKHKKQTQTNAVATINKKTKQKRKKKPKPHKFGLCHLFALHLCISTKTTNVQTFCIMQKNKTMQKKKQPNIFVI